ncbi:hypothetical protein V494_04634 [Pseudogymnoascus sp. VKM F-4513 (FW-928)]|nr:hypothetical protein V494_04634 [Pseudogymnoascus sp. VKM F-4513 (FW-928)]
MLPRTDCRKRSSSIRSLVLFENAMLGIATILAVGERCQLFAFREKGAPRPGRAARTADAALEGGGILLALGTAEGLGGGDNSQLYKKAPTLSRREPLQPGEPGVANGRRPIFLAKEIKQQEIDVKKAGWERGEEVEVERERERRIESREREVVRVDVGCGAEVVDRGPLFLGIRLRQSSSSGPRNGKGNGLECFFEGIWTHKNGRSGEEGSEKEECGEI